VSVPRELFTPRAVDRASEEAPYRQVTRLVHDAVVTGELRTGEQLPPERELARRLGVGRATVARALGELADSGLLERRVGRGTVVAFDHATWSAGPTAAIPWGALLTAIAPGRVARDPTTARRKALAEELGLPGRGAESLVLTGSMAEGTRLLVDALLRPGARAIVEAPASEVLSTALAMRPVEAIAVGGGRGTIAGELERLIEGRPNARLVWLRRGSGLRRDGDRAHLAGLTKREGLPVIEEVPASGAGGGLLGFEPSDHVVRVGDGWISAPVALARLLRPLALALGMGAADQG
jgi:DNA-binding transcriptional ArsR family regulator